MTKMQILDAIIGGTGMVMIHDSVGIYRGKLSDDNKKLLLGDTAHIYRRSADGCSLCEPRF